MRVLGRDKIEKFKRKHADVASQLEAWLFEIKDTNWHSPKEIKKRFPSASILAGNRFIFNLKGNKYRLDAKFDFRSNLAIVIRIGTHAEYSKWEL